MRSRSWCCFLTLFLLAGCPGRDDDETDDDDVVDDDSGDDDVVDDDSGDDDTQAEQALLRFDGNADVDLVAYQGSEDMAYIANLGGGPDVCRIRVDLSSTATRDDCTGCSWAFDLVVSNVEVTAESDPGCEAFGLGAAEIAALEGSTRAYGYIFEYLGHADVVMDYRKDTWEVLSFATWSDTTDALDYGWDEAYVDVE